MGTAERSGVNETVALNKSLGYGGMGEKQGDEDYQKKTQEFLAKLVEFHEKSG